MFLHTFALRVMHEEQNWLGGKEAIGFRHSAKRGALRSSMEVRETRATRGRCLHGFLSFFVNFVFFVFTRF